MKKKYLFIMLFSILFLAVSCSGETQSKKSSPGEDDQNIKVTFIELGSVRCIPCKKMIPIVEEIKKEYKGQVKVVFHDVWTSEGKPYAAKYKIRLIPTQVFLDSEGKEYHRHEGFYPKEEILKILKLKGVGKK